MTIKNPVEKLFMAIGAGDNSRVLALSVYNNRILQCTNKNGLTPLVDAIIIENYDAMRVILLHGANSSQVDKDGWSAKIWAIFIQDKEAQKILSKHL